MMIPSDFSWVVAEPSTRRACGGSDTAAGELLHGRGRTVLAWYLFPTTTSAFPASSPAFAGQ